MHAVGSQRRAWPNGHTRALRILLQHVLRLGGGDAEPASLADGELVLALVTAQNLPIGIDHVAGPPRGVKRSGRVAAQEVNLARAGEEAEVLALAPVGHGEPRVSREAAHARLLELAEREPQALQLLWAQASQHVALVLGRVGRAAQEGAGVVLGDPSVVTGREPLGAEAAGQLEHLVEADQP